MHFSINVIFFSLIIQRIHCEKKVYKKSEISQSNFLRDATELKQFLIKIHPGGSWKMGIFKNALFDI